MIEPLHDDTLRSELANLRGFLDCIHSSELLRYSYSTDSEIAVTIALSLGHLITLKLFECHQAGPLSVAAILGNCHCLEYLDPSGCGSMNARIESTNIRSILCKAPKLRTLLTIADDTVVLSPLLEPGEAFVSGWATLLLEAHDVVSEWATRSWELFDCPIVFA